MKKRPPTAEDADKNGEVFAFTGPNESEPIPWKQYDPAVFPCGWRRITAADYNGGTEVA